MLKAELKKTKKGKKRAAECKRVISAVAAIMLIFVFSTASYADTNALDQAQTDAFSKVAGLGILQGDEGGFRLDDNITRAEFATVACRLLSCDNLKQSETGFSDVPALYWASGYVAMAKNMGITNGVGGNMFAPDANITYNEVLKMIVSLLGYGMQAEEKGGWPDGYLLQANALGLSKDLDFKDGIATRGGVAIIINNALEVKPLEPEWGNENGYLVSEKTLYEILSEHKDAVEFEGVYQENKVSSIISANPSCDKDSIIIDGTSYKSDKLYTELLGRYVRGIAREYRSGRYEIVSIYAADYENNVNVTDAKNGEITAAYAIMYDDSGKGVKTNIELGAKYLYNGRLTANPASYRTLDDAKFTLIDNTGDKVADVVLIEAGKSLVADRVNENTSTAYFKTGELFEGRRGISLVADESNEHSFVYIEDKQGTAISASDVSAGAVLTIFASEDISLYTIRVSSDSVEGRVTGIGDDVVEIDGEQYECLISLSVGDEGVFAIDAYGRIAGSESFARNVNYGYVIDAMRDSGIKGKVKIQIISADKPQKEVKTKDGVETISYNLQNDEPVVFECADKLRYSEDTYDGSASSISASSLNTANLADSICSYRLNADGEISHLGIYHMPTELVSTTLNAEILAFGGSSSARGFATDENTKIICVPNFVKTEEDYSVRVKISNKGSYKVYGVKATSEFNPNGSEAERERYRSEEVDVLILKTNMDSTVPLPILDDANICIVGDVSAVSNSDGAVVMKLEFIDDDKIVTKYTRDSGESFDTALTLRMGDLIRYSENGDGTIANIEHIASVQGQQTYKADANAKHGYKFHYGLCEDIIYSSYDGLMNDYIDSLTLYFDGASENKTVKLVEEDIQIYLYNRRNGTVQTATTDDVVTLQQSGDATCAFVVLKSNDPYALVIIKD